MSERLDLFIPPDAPRDPGAILVADNIEQLRQQQKDELFKTAFGPFPANSAESLLKQKEFYSESVARLNEQFLKTNGIGEDHPRRDEFLTLINRFSIHGPHHISTDPAETTPWEMSVDSNGNARLSGRELFEREWEQMFGQPATVEDQPDHEAILTEVLERQNIAQAATNVAFVDRMKARFWEKKRFQRELDARRGELDAVTREMENAQIAKWQAEGKSEEEIAEKLAERANDRLSSRPQSRQRALIENTFLGGLYERYANLSRGKKLIVKLGVGALAAAGVTATTLTLGLGGGLVTAGGAVASRAYRAYKLQQADMYGVAGLPGTERVEFKNANGSIRSHQDILDEAQVKDAKELDARIENGDKVKRKAVVIAVGAVAVGGVMLAAEHTADLGVWNHDHAAHATNEPPKDTGAASDTGGNRVGAGAENPGGKVHEAIPWTTGDSISDAAHTISHGEGWYQTFSEMGITTAHDQARLLNDDVLMGKLANMKLAYVDQRIGGWGIRMTPDGKMPQAAIDLINQHAAQSGLISAR